MGRKRRDNHHQTLKQARNRGVHEIYWGLERGTERSDSGDILVGIGTDRSDSL